MGSDDSVSIAISGFLCRIEHEGQLPSSVVVALRQLADSGRLSDQAAVERAIEAEGEGIDEAETDASERRSRSS